ncbi:MAG TPA: hypothetical protein VNV63_07405 [Nitrospiria bacterium]|jgi:hypothetical protein|nr:hypothetical protein [Nitrospiria bacterium]
MISPFTPHQPVFGPEKFFGRGGLVRSLVQRLRDSQSVLLYGGPRIGKTSMLLQVRSQLKQTVFLDLASQADLAALWSGNHDSVILLDGCDQIAKQEGLLEAVQKFIQGPVAPKAIVLTGGRAWREYVRDQRIFDLKLQPFPLAVYLDKEAKSFLKPYLAVADIAEMMRFTGNHPYLLQLLMAEWWRHRRQDFARLALGCGKELDDFFKDSLAQLGYGLERRLLDYLIEQGRPINPRQAAKDLGQADIKPAADMLCYLGLISRWIRDTEATLSAGCELFNDRYRKLP